MVEHLMGGVAVGEKNARLITKIEQSIVKGIVLRALADIQRAWKTVAELSFKLERLESEGEFVQIAPASELVLVVSFEVVIGAQKYPMNVCFPTFALEDVLAKLNVQHFSGLSAVKGESEWSAPIVRQLGTTKVPVTGLLGETSMTLRELLELEEGDIVRTNIPISSEIQMQIGAKTRVWGRPGVSKGHMALKVTRTQRDHSTGE